MLTKCYSINLPFVKLLRTYSYIKRSSYSMFRLIFPFFPPYGVTRAVVNTAYFPPSEQLYDVFLTG